MYITREKNGIWTRNLTETDPVDIEEVKTIQSNIIAANHMKFFKDGQKYIDLSLNLNDIGSPSDYPLMFFTWTDAMKFNGFADATVIRPIPPQYRTPLILNGQLD
jgi:hypothetical protein